MFNDIFGGMDDLFKEDKKEKEKEKEEKDEGVEVHQEYQLFKNEAAEISDEVWSTGKEHDIWSTGGNDVWSTD